MPIMDGFESVRRYRAFEQSHLLPGHKPLFILGMSANNDDESIKEALTAGMNAFVTKPYNYPKLVAVLAQSEIEFRAQSRPTTPSPAARPPPTPPAVVKAFQEGEGETAHPTNVWLRPSTLLPAIATLTRAPSLFINKSLPIFPSDWGIGT